MASTIANVKAIVARANTFMQIIRRSGFAPPADIATAIVGVVFAKTAQRCGYSEEKTIDLLKIVWRLAKQTHDKSIIEV